MNSRIVGLRVASAVFGLVCVGQIGRLMLGLKVNVAGHSIPLWLSGVAVVVTGLLCAWLWQLSRETDAAPPAA